MAEYLIEIPICRVCLQPSVECIEMDSIMINGFGDSVSKTYFECFKLCTSLDIKNENEEDLPKHICCQCSDDLRATYEFIVKAKNSHDILLMQVGDLKLEYLVEEFDSQGNDQLDEIIYLPANNMNEICEEECGDFEGVMLEDCDKKQYSEEQEIEEIDEVDQESQVSEVCVEADDGDFDNLTIKSTSENEDYPTEHQELGDKIECNICQCEFDKIDDLREHGEQEHAKIRLVCRLCFHRFTSKYALTDHIKSNHNDSYENCDICGTSVKSTFLRIHKRQVHKRIPYLCSACPRTFKTTTGLQIHLETHKENRQRNFECDQCHKKFLTERTYKVHVRTHWHREPFQCTLCDKKFLQKVNLRLHMQMHRGETMDCMYCDKKFVRKTDLNVHMRFHTGNFPYVCKYCDKRFAIISHLNYHEKRHQGLIYKCDVCDKQFINMSGLRNHSFSHTRMPFYCVFCDKGFPTKFKIKRHLKTVHHVDDPEGLDQCISTEKVKSEANFEELNEDELLMVDEDQSIEV